MLDGQAATPLQSRVHLLNQHTGTDRMEYLMTLNLSVDLSSAALLLALLILGLRIFNYAISTMRLVFITRGMRLLASATAFVEALIFAVVITQIVTDLSNVTLLVAYCAGAAIGSYLGMWLETRLVTSYSTVTIIAQANGREIAAALRENNYGATVTYGEGLRGRVTIIRSSAVNRDVPLLLDIVHRIQSDAFIDIESARTVRRGWLPGGPARR